MATPVRRISRLEALGDDLLLEIFLRIGRPVDLTRASAACVTFRRLITDPTFLLRYHNHHKPLLLGVLSLEVSDGFQPIEVPHPNTPAAYALANIVSFDYLPQDERNHWFITRDVRDGRILLESDDTFLPDFAVCDPLSRRYLKLPPIPHYDEDEDFGEVNAVFAPCADEDDDATSFRVIALMQYETKLVVAVFDSGSGSWSLGTSSRWEALRLSLRNIDFTDEYPGHAYGCLYWKVYRENKLLKLDINRMELSTVDLPPDHHDNVWHLVVVEAEKGRLGLFSCTPGRKFINYYNLMQSEDQRANEWQMKNRIALPVHHSLWIVGAPRGYIFLQVDQGSEHTTCYSLDIHTLKLERVIQMSSSYFLGYPYFVSRPSMSPRRICNSMLL